MSMMIERPTAAGRQLTFRTDDEMYLSTKDLALELGTTPSTLSRLALANLLVKARATRAKSVSELQCHEL